MTPAQACVCEIGVHTGQLQVSAPPQPSEIVEQMTPSAAQVVGTQPAGWHEPLMLKDFADRKALTKAAETIVTAGVMADLGSAE